MSYYISITRRTQSLKYSHSVDSGEIFRECLALKRGSGLGELYHSI